MKTLVTACKHSDPPRRLLRCRTLEIGVLHRSGGNVVADLERTQDTIGRLHDAEVLLDSLESLVGKADVDDRELAILKNDLQGEIAERHAKYLMQRERLRAAQGTRR